MILKQSTATIIKLGPFVDSIDGNTEESALTIQKADVRLSKNGGAFAAASSDQGAADAGAAYDEGGFYEINLDSTDTGTLGRLTVAIHKSGALPVSPREYWVVPANVYDSLFGSDKLQVDVAQIDGSTTIDGVDIDSFLEALLAFVAPSKTVRTDNEDGTYQLDSYKQDGTTIKMSHTYNLNGEWTGVEIDP